MVLTRTDENELLTALHGGMTEEEPWHLFLLRLLARVEADFVQVMLRPSVGNNWQRAAQVQNRRLPSDFILPDPPLDRMRPGRVYSGSELGDSGFHAARHMQVGLAEAGDLCLSLIRREEDFSASDSALLASLAPHLAIAGRTLGRLERESVRTALVEGELRLFGGGWLLLDAQARLLDCDTQTAMLVAQGQIMGRAADGRLRFLLPEAEELLADAAAGGGAVSCRAGWLWHDPPMQMLAMAPPDGMGRAFAAARSFIRIRTLPHGDGNSVSASILSALFRLTPSEARFAVRMANGNSIAEAANALGLTLETARNYSKRIYGKMGVRGQVDLIRVFAESVREKAVISVPSGDLP